MANSYFLSPYLSLLFTRQECILASEFGAKAQGYGRSGKKKGNRMTGSLFIRALLGAFAWYAMSNYNGYLIAILTVVGIAAAFAYFMGKKEAAPVVAGAVTTFVLSSLGVPEFLATVAAGLVVVPVVFGLVFPKVSQRMPALT